MIDKTYDDLQEARGRIKALENQLSQITNQRDEYAAEVQRMKVAGLGGGIVFDRDTREGV